MSDIIEKLHTLQQLSPYLIDATLRENAVGSLYGQTLTQKVHLFHELRRFGLSKIILGALNYPYPDELQVDDDFMCYLRDNMIDTSECFCMTDVGSTTAGVFAPSVSQQKMLDYRVKNTIHEVYLSAENTSNTHTQILHNIAESVSWLRNNISSCGDIILNIVDGCDAFATNEDLVKNVLQLASSLKLEGVSIEDDRGTYFPFQIASFIRTARAALPSSTKLLVHFHSGNGMENASTIEALLNGADGAWGGMVKYGGVSGHASLSELIGNLTRLGNKHIGNYKLSELRPLTNLIDRYCGMSSQDAPVYGQNVHRLNLTYFKQKSERFLDLPPETIGGSYIYQICPVMSDIRIIEERLRESLGIAHTQQSVIQYMIYLMRRNLRAGVQVKYDDPVHLRNLYNQAMNHTKSEQVL